MADESDNLALQMLRRIDAKQHRLTDDVQDLKMRMTHVGKALAGVNRRVGRLEMRFDRIEPRLELTDASL